MKIKSKSATLRFIVASLVLRPRKFLYKPNWSGFLKERTRCLILELHGTKLQLYNSLLIKFLKEGSTIRTDSSFLRQKI